jgi:hypothetical protein
VLPSGLQGVWDGHTRVFDADKHLAFVARLGAAIVATALQLLCSRR